MTEKNTKQTFYTQLAKEFEKLIDDGTWKKGNAIPSERQLCQLYSVSRITVRKAIDELEKQGKLEKIHGKGNFVVERSIVQNLGYVYSFSKEMEKQGKITTTKLIRQERIVADVRLSLQLGISIGEGVIFVERLRYADQRPILLERTYFPENKYAFVLTMDLKNKQLYRSLEEYGIIIDKAFETFKVCNLKKDERELLQSEKEQYGLLIKRTAYSNEQLVSYSTIVSNGDIFEFTVKLVL